MDLSYSKCNLCSRRCNIDRSSGELGFCGMSDSVCVARAALHMWEEPPISGERGSGTIFFSGCSLGCVFCQNNKISHGRAGKNVTVSRLSEIMRELQNKGAHNINFVTPTHYAPSVKEAVALAKEKRAQIEYDEASAAPYFRYFERENGTPVEHVVWFENANSVAALIDLVRELNLDGIGVWTAMKYFPQLWLVLNATYPIRKIFS